jgi:hypothetical protein
MRLLLRTGNASYTRITATVALVGQLFGMFGGVIPVRAARDAHSRIAFPCQDRHCGCRTAESCWKGDCCCFTLAQKAKWAEERGIEPPPHVRALLMPREQRKSEPPCCASRRSTERGLRPTCVTRHDSPEPQRHLEHHRWVLRLEWQIAAKQCRGEDDKGFIDTEPAIPPSTPTPLLDRATPTMLVDGRVIQSHVLPSRPPLPPPRHS